MHSLLLLPLLNLDGRPLSSGNGTLDTHRFFQLLPPFSVLAKLSYLGFPFLVLVIVDNGSVGKRLPVLVSEFGTKAVKLRRVTKPVLWTAHLECFGVCNAGEGKLS